MIRKLGKYYKKYMRLNIIGVLSLILSIVALTYVPTIVKDIIDIGLKQKQFDVIAPLCITLFFTALARAIFLYLRNILFHRVSQNMVYDFRLMLFDKLQALQFSFFDKESTGRLMNRFTGDLNALRVFLVNGPVLLIDAIVQLLLILVMMFAISKNVAYAMLAVIPFIFVNTMFLKKKLHKAFIKVRSSFEGLMSYVQENIAGIKVVKVFNREDSEKERFKSKTEDFMDANINTINIRATHNPLGGLILNISRVVICCFGGYLAIKGELTIGELVAFNTYALMLATPLNQINNYINQYQNARSSHEKIMNVLDEIPSIKNKDNAIKTNSIIGNISFKKVYFRYHNNNVLMDINIKIKAGQVVGIMGATGSGKSTIINLISRFYDTGNGSVEIDGINVKDYDLEGLRRNVGVIMQETFLFSDTIENNIKYGRSSASKEEVIAASKMADAYEFIEKLPDGFDTMLGERGSGLSGGQKQRLAIARAILFNPRILVLDDATSSVDMETERNIQKTLSEVMKNRTTIVIAHRISAVKDADLIVCMDHGRIVESGNHESLLLEEGYYFKTYIQQYEKEKVGKKNG